MTWSPWYGCTQVSMGPQGACEGCYARQLSETRFGRVVFGGPGRGEGTRDVRADVAWKEPLRWERAAAASRRAWFAPDGPPEGGLGKPWPYSPFVFPSMCDPFDNHPALAEPRRRFFDLIRATPHLTWLLLTKRPGNIVKMARDCYEPWREPLVKGGMQQVDQWWPRNAAIGCTVVTQEEADRDIPRLLRAKSELRPAFAFLSMEPLLGPVDFARIPWRFNAMDVDAPGAPVKTFNPLTGEVTSWDRGFPVAPGERAPAIDWIIAGGESGSKARPSHPDWFREVAGQCAEAGVPFHFKQWGEWTPGENAGPATSAQDGAYIDDYTGEASVTRFSLRALEGLHIDDEPDVWRVGKARAGRLLDGVAHDARPEVRI